MAAFEVTMKHSEATLEALSHMQYDLFCKRNRVSRTLLSAAAMITGVLNFADWWGILLVAYGAYLGTSTYSSANRTAHKLAQGIRASGMDFPCSAYLFEEDALHILSLPGREELDEPLLYSQARALGEDAGYYYIFRDEYGGYMIPKRELGDSYAAFRDFVEKKTGKIFTNPASPLMRFLARRRKRLNDSEPYHL